MTIKKTDGESKKPRRKKKILTEAEKAERKEKRRLNRLKKKTEEKPPVENQKPTEEVTAPEGGEQQAPETTETQTADTRDTGTEAGVDEGTSVTDDDQTSEETETTDVTPTSDNASESDDQGEESSTDADDTDDGGPSEHDEDCPSCVRALDKYCHDMQPNRPMNEAEGVRHQTFLYNALVSACVHEHRGTSNQEVIVAMFDRIHANVTKAFADHLIGRYNDLLAMPSAHRRGFVLLVNAFRSLSDPETRYERAKGMDWEALQNSLPQKQAEEIVSAVRRACNLG